MYTNIVTHVRIFTAFVLHCSDLPTVPCVLPTLLNGYYPSKSNFMRHVRHSQCVVACVCGVVPTPVGLFPTMNIRACLYSVKYMYMYMHGKCISPLCMQGPSPTCSQTSGCCFNVPFPSLPFPLPSLLPSPLPSPT